MDGLPANRWRSNLASAALGTAIRRHSIEASFASRNFLFASLVVVGFANGISDRVSLALAETDVAAALANTFGISVIVWSAWAISLVFLMRTPLQPISRLDGIVAAAALLAFLVPIAPLSWLAIAGLAIHILRTSPSASFLQRGAWILLALTVPMLWSRLLFVMLSEAILQADATLVGWIVGTPRLGNAIQFADGSGYLWIAPGCSSLANISLAFLCWATIAKVLNRPSSPSDIGWVVLACTAVAVVNVTRISLMGLYRNHFDLLHGPVGATVASWLTLGVTVTICLLGTRRDLPVPPYTGPAVTFPPALSGAIGLVLAVTLSLKLPGLMLLTSPMAPAPGFSGEAARLLEQHGLEVDQVSPGENLAGISGATGACRVRINDVMPQGWQQSLVAGIAGDHHLVYLFNGRNYSEQPLLRTRADYYWSRLNRYLGRNVPTRPVIVVIFTPACNGLPLRELTELSGR
ncbi:hypothetical protein IC232_26305 [Microvirga sp. BT688]|uniref:hypothetical protein n=1 Tax=Microvirga sp. TaxID=1873136 RepID=UPI0016823372|nr:hypothetical protein [Microvirga sp.]MBD2750183.1 hypothetical protein [Microvirga sp.]